MDVHFAHISIYTHIIAAVQTLLQENTNIDKTEQKNPSLNNFTSKNFDEENGCLQEIETFFRVKKVCNKANYVPVGIDPEKGEM